jgi:hypothetical protein
VKWYKVCKLIRNQKKVRLVKKSMLNVFRDVVQVSANGDMATCFVPCIH